jgi:hypothetical protein
VREASLQRVASRGAQRCGDPATDPRGVKRDGRGAEALPTCWGAYHEEAEAHEGQVDRQGANRVLVVRTDFHADQGPVDDKRRGSCILGDAPRAPRLPHLGRGKASRREERQEGMPAATSRRGCVAGTNP